MDSILLEEIEVPAIIGTEPEERTVPQIVIITAELGGDFREAALADDLTLTFDYAAVEKRIYDFTANSRFFLLEALAERLTEELLAIPHIESVSLTIHKPAAPKFAKKVSVSIQRFRH